jgi:hypothetical protein
MERTAFRFAYGNLGSIDGELLDKVHEAAVADAKEAGKPAPPHPKLIEHLQRERSQVNDATMAMWQTSEVTPFLSKAAEDPDHAEAHLAAAAEVARVAAREKMVVLDRQIGNSVSINDEQASMKKFDEADPIRAMRRRASADAETLRLKAYDPFLWLEDQKAKLREERLRKAGHRSNANLDEELERQKKIAQEEERKRELQTKVVHAFQWRRPRRPRHRPGSRCPTS